MDVVKDHGVTVGSDQAPPEVAKRQMWKKTARFQPSEHQELPWVAER